MNTRIFLLFFCTLLFGLPSRSDTKHSISWLGNTFPGGSEQWVQNFVTEIAVTPDGTLYTSSEWDEAGRCVGAYKDGQANKQLFRQYDGRGGHNAWGWGTSSKAVTADDAHLYLINTDGELLRFRRADYGYKDQVSVGKALDMTHRDGVLYIVREGGSEVQLRKAQDLSLIRSFKADGAEDVAVDAKKRIWLRSGKQVRAFDANGNALPPVIKGLENPSDITVGSDGRLIVCENGTARFTFTTSAAWTTRRR